MKIRKYILRTLLLIAVAFITQTITFLLLAPRQLKNQIPTLQLPDNKIYSDSMFVRDYYTTDCRVGDRYTIDYEINLDTESKKLRELYKVKYIYFANSSTSTWEDKTPDKYKIYYEGYARGRNWKSLFGFYDCRIDEIIILNHNHIISRQSYYRWYLFKWVQTSEHKEEYDINPTL